MTRVKIPMGMHNVFRVVESDMKDQESNKRAMIYPFTALLLSSLSRKRPQWEFWSEGIATASRAGNTYQYARYNIYEKGENLGWIDHEQKSAGHAYTFDNPRLRKNRNRGNYTSTVKLESAHRLIIENIYALTPAERLAQANDRIGSQVNQHYASANRKASEAKRKLDVDVFTFALARWAEFKQAVPPGLLEAAEEYPTLIEIEQQMDRLSTARGKKTGCSVVIHGELYFVQWEGQPLVSFTSDGLPEKIKEGVGILKLCETNVPIPDVGIKVSDKQFLVMAEEEQSVEQNEG